MIATPLIEVDEAACTQVAAILGEQLRAGAVPPDEEDTSLPDVPRDLVGNFYLALVAICHQTSPRNRAPLEGKVGGRHLRGWDYLLAKFEAATARETTLLEPAVWAAIHADEVRALFADEALGDRLTDTTGRAVLLRGLGERMITQNWQRVDALYEACDGRLATGHPNLLEMLGGFRAYDDPVRKKSLFFLALMRNSGTWHYRDDENLGPPVDYHEVRGHLRLATVVVRDAALDRKVRAGDSVSAQEDVAIRQAVYDAIMLISRKSGVCCPSRMHYLFWNVFRSVCTRERPQCLAVRHDALPERYRALARFADGERRCPFSGVCLSARCEDRVVEHVFETDYY